MSLANKSLTDLRSIAQSYDIPELFKKDKLQLVQAIEMKQRSMIPEPKIEIPKPEYDARLMAMPPSKRSVQADIEKLLVPYVAKGLRLSFSEEQWFMSFQKRNDEGTLRMPLKHVLKCAERVMA